MLKSRVINPLAIQVHIKIRGVNHLKNRLDDRLHVSLLATQILGQQPKITNVKTKKERS
jgi:hypothetical protein